MNENCHPDEHCHPDRSGGTCVQWQPRLVFKSKMRLNVKLYRHIIVVCSLLFALPAALAQAPKSDTSLTGDPVFQKNCTKCHGRTAEGRHFGGPSLISEAATSASADDLRAIITKGKHHMPKYGGKLTPEEINALVDEIKAAKK
jgi:mono/diheme cytochrome c family protein